MGGKVDCFLRMTGEVISLLCGGAGVATGDNLCWEASWFVGIECALARGEEAGLSEARYVVAKMLSRSDSCGRSTDDFQSRSSGAIGAVLERPACERLLGVTASWAKEGVDDPWPGWCGAFDLTDAGGEAVPWASGCGDMGSTLVRPSLRRSRGCVAEPVAEDAGRALATVARMRLLGAAGAQRNSQQGRTSERGRWRGRIGRAAAQDPGGQRVRISGGPRSDVVWIGVQDPGGAKILQARDRNDVCAGRHGARGVLAAIVASGGARDGGIARRRKIADNGPWLHHSGTLHCSHAGRQRESHGYLFR